TVADVADDLAHAVTRSKSNSKGDSMTALAALWLPILVSAIVVFVASSLIHMATPWHKADYQKIPNEDQAMDALRPLAIPPGDYMVPNCRDMKEMKTAAFIDKRQKGPVIIAT